MWRHDGEETNLWLLVDLGRLIYMNVVITYMNYAFNPRVEAISAIQEHSIQIFSEQG